MADYVCKALKLEGEMEIDGNWDMPAVIAMLYFRYFNLEITEPVFWTIEYRLPQALLLKYSPVTPPGRGTEWKVNLYKIAENSSNPHYLPQFFGTTRFQ